MQIQCYHAIAMPLGFVLVGGKSTRMRRDKSLLDWYHQPLYQHLASTLHPFCSEVILLGPGRPEFQGFRVLPDAIGGVGPLGGLASALTEPGDPWRLVLSCDVPLVDAELIAELLQLTRAPGGLDADVILPLTSDGQLHPLCALWSTRAAEPLLSHLQFAMAAPDTSGGGLSVRRFVRTLRSAEFSPSKPHLLRNINTMRDYLAALKGRASPEE